MIERAREILEELELNENNSVKVLSENSNQPRQLNLFYDSVDELSGKIIKELKKMDLNKITPIKALNILNKWKDKLENNKQ